MNTYSESRGLDIQELPRRSAGYHKRARVAKAFANAHGQFRAKAKAAGKTTAAYARAVLKKGSSASTKTKRQANLALNASKFHHK